MTFLRSILTAVAVSAATAVFATEAPRNPAFAEWSGRSERSHGRIPSPVNRTHLASSYETVARARRPSRLLRAEAPVPARWDAREHGWVSPIRNQGSYGTCWTFSTVAALETAILKATDGSVTNDFSENHLATHDVGFAIGFSDGGYEEMSAALLTSWRDPLNERDDPYPNPSSRVTAPSVCHVQDLVWLPERTAGHTASADEMAEANLLYKRAVMTYGALSASYTHCHNHFNNETAAHYVNANAYVSTGNDGGHAVTLIGWDDDYPIANFRSGRRPPAPGAFLFKNSWGDGYGTTNGCLWVSYYDDSVLKAISTAYPAAEATDNYGRIFQYDPCGQTTSWNVYEEGEAFGEKQNWCANVFTPDAEGELAAVGTYALSAGTRYTLRLSLDCADDPASGQRVFETNGVTETAGYFTLRLPEPIPFAAGEKFAVAFLLDCPDTDFPLPVEATLYDYDGTPFVTASARFGESFMSADGIRWEDFHRFDKTANFCIKAYTRTGSDGEIVRLIETAWPSDDNPHVRCGDRRSFGVTLTADQDRTDATFEWSLSGVLLANDTAELDFAPTDADHGLHTLACRVRRNGKSETRSWTVCVNRDFRVADSRTLQDALLVAIEGDRVFAAPGTYEGTVCAPEALIEIRSEEGPESTVLIASEDDRCYDGTLNPDTLLAGFTLRGGHNAYGGGIRSGTASNCVIECCTAQHGGGAYDAFLTDCVLRDNTSTLDGGAADFSTLVTCLLARNTACRGGGAYNSELVSCLVTGNTANRAGNGYYGTGGGVQTCDLYNCTVTSNRAYTSGGASGLRSVTTVNSIITGNVCTRGKNYGNDVTSTEAAFPQHSLVGKDAGFADAANGDFHLTVGSPALDAGSVNDLIGPFDLDGQTRLFGPRPDLGCYEYSHLPPDWPVPNVRPDASDEEEARTVRNTLSQAGFTPGAAEALPTVRDYLRFADWAESNGIALADLASSPVPILSAALRTDAPIRFGTDGPRLSSFSIASDGRVSMSLALDSGMPADGPADETLLRAAVRLLASPTLTEASPVQKEADAVRITNGVLSIESASGTNRFFRSVLR